MESFVDVELALKALDGMLKSMKPEKSMPSISEKDREELMNFLARDGGPDHLCFPAFMGECLLRVDETREVWNSLSKLSETSRKLIFYSAAGHDPKIIAETLGLGSDKEYWELLRESQAALSVNGEKEDNQDIIRSLNAELRDLLEEFLEKADQLEDQQKKTTKRKRGFTYGSLGLLLLGLFYFVGWNHFFPPKDLDVVNQRINLISVDLSSEMDSLTIIPEIIGLLENDEHAEILRIIEEENVLGNTISDKVLCLYSLLLLKSERYSESRDYIRQVKIEDQHIYLLYLKGMSWRMRFLRNK